MLKCVVYVCFFYVLMLFVSGNWYASYNDTRQLSRYAASAAALYLMGFIHLDLDA